MLKILFYLLFCSIASANIVQVTSIYADDSDNSRQLKVSGSGLIFTRDGRQFVFTASHVSQGKETRIYLDGAELSIKGRSRHSKSDLELFEVTGAPVSSIQATYVNGYIEFQENASRRRWLDQNNYVPLLDWIVDTKVDIDNEFAKGRRNVFSLNPTAELLNADSLIQPGMSGAPLLAQTPADFDAREKLSNAPSDRTIVRAMAIRRDRFFARASFVPYAIMDQVLNRYLEAKPYTELKQWYARGAILYRKAKVHREISGLSASMAGGTVADVGNGISMDGGDLATLSEDTPDDFLNKVSPLMATENDPILYWSMPFVHPVKTDEALRFGTWFDMELYPMGPGGTIFMGVNESNRPDLAVELLWRFRATDIFEVKTPAHLKIDYKAIEFKIPLAGGDRIEVELTRQGYYCPRKVCRDKFQPIFEVTSIQGRAYIVDLREFFFLDIAAADLPSLGNLHGLSDDEQKTQVYESVRKSLFRPRVIYRPKKPSPSEPLTVEQGQRMMIEW